MSTITESPNHPTTAPTTTATVRAGLALSAVIGLGEPSVPVPRHRLGSRRTAVRAAAAQRRDRHGVGRLRRRRVEHGQPHGHSHQRRCAHRQRADGPARHLLGVAGLHHDRLRRDRRRHTSLPWSSRCAARTRRARCSTEGDGPTNLFSTPSAPAWRHGRPPWRSGDRSGGTACRMEPAVRRSPRSARDRRAGAGRGQRSVTSHGGVQSPGTRKSMPASSSSRFATWSSPTSCP